MNFHLFPHEGKKEMIRIVIKLLLYMVFLGSIMIWIMVSTSTYRQVWMPTMRDKANSKFVGAQGATILVYTFPILFIATFGCVYLHLGQKCKENYIERKGGKNYSLWKRPFIVKGPLGIVSLTEFAFITMFLGLLIWSFSTYLHIGSARKSGEKIWEAKVEILARRFGLIGNICFSFLFFPVTRGSSILPLFGLKSEASIKYHMWLGHIVMILFTAHGLCFTLFWAGTHHISWILAWAKVGISNFAGVLSLVFGFAMWATSLPFIRRKMFEVFFYTHHLYSLFLIFFVLHVGISYSCIMLPGLYLFLIDRYLRFLQSQQRVQLVSARILPCATVELNFSKSPELKYTATSIMFINIPSISKMQWHPFTLTSNSSLEPECLSAVIKSEGGWTRRLCEILSSPSVDHLDVAIEGPYGPTSTHFTRHDTLVMVSGGSGITPFISIIRELIFRSTTMYTKSPRIILICAFKLASDLTMLDLLLPISGTPSDISSLQLQIDAYVTRDKQPPKKREGDTRTVWLNPNVLDQPVSALLGPNSWLWLGVIISCSFVIYLVLLGMLTRYYIYPIDRNTNNIFPTTWRALINMLLMCGCISLTASAVVIRNKKHNSMDVKHKGKGALTPMDMPSECFYNAEQSPPHSPGPWFYNVDRELESFANESLVQETYVHFGERPNLKKLLFDIGGSSVGVLVSGPSKMRHEVASICSSGLADNLHFESISFSW